jgi:hypothetical protein
MASVVPSFNEIGRLSLADHPLTRWRIILMMLDDSYFQVEPN